jgi:hypothetical protein
MITDTDQGHLTRRSLLVRGGELGLASTVAGRSLLSAAPALGARRPLRRSRRRRPISLPTPAQGPRGLHGDGGVRTASDGVR